MKELSNILKPQSSFLLFVLVSVSFFSVHGQADSGALLEAIKEIPEVYYTPEAYSYYSRSGQFISPQPPRETITKVYRTVLPIVNMGVSASNYVAELIRIFPKIVHVTEIRNAQYAGEGTFEDWLMTYITSEKNKFIISSSVIDFKSMSLCESSVVSENKVDYIDKRTGASGKLMHATVNISVVFTLHIGSCLLSKITNVDIGNEKQSWQNWYQKNGSQTGIVTSALQEHISSKNLSGGQSFNDILLKGTYKMVLTTGDELTGVVEFKNDTTLILETTDGKPYTFRRSLIRQYELVKHPQGQNFSNTSDGGIKLTFEELLNTKVDKFQIEIIIAGGSLFRGTLDFIDETMLKINIDGARIPITREVIRSIILTPKKKDSTLAEQGNKLPLKEPNDTLIIKNSEPDEWGKSKPDFIYEGIIQNSNDNSVTFKMTSGTIKAFDRSVILRIIRNTKDSNEEPIKRYAKPLFCPDEMFLVDMPPGKKGKPFFKICVDRYEYPNKKETVPTVSVSYMEARNICESQGKRLCTAEEWQWACGGLEGYAYPYGWNREENTCNTEGTRLIEPSGARHNCVSKFGGYDMTGNIFEWVTGSNNEPALMGGPYSKCQTVSPGLDGSAKSQIGLRCCKSN